MALADDDHRGDRAAKLAAEGANLVLEGNMDHAGGNHPRGDRRPDSAAMAIATRSPSRQGASATVIETFVGEGDYLSNAVIEIDVGEGARLDRVKIEREADKATHLGHAIVTLAKTRILRDFTLTSGSALNRQNGTYTFTGAGRGCQDRRRLPSERQATRRHAAGR